MTGRHDIRTGSPITERWQLAKNPCVRALVSQSVSKIAAWHRLEPGSSPDDAVALLIGSPDDPVKSAQAKAHRLIQSGYAINDVIEHVIPEAARQMGQAWLDDTLSFAAVSIGTARLQQLVRILGMQSRSYLDPNTASPTVLITTQPGEDHTLGALVATNQLRRLGIDTRLSLGVETALLVDLLNTNTIDAVFVSAATRTLRSNLKSMVDTLGRKCEAAPPFVLGGSLTSSDAEASYFTEAGLIVESDPIKALSLCGLSLPIGPLSRSSAA